VSFATVRGRDGVELAYREVGEGRPLVLLHGFTCSAAMHWIDPGHAERLAGLGYRVVLPELRGHGDSDIPRDAASYPDDVFVDDLLALIERLELDDYDLGGYSLGGRTALRATIRGAAPGRLVVAGMGMDGMIDANGFRNDLYRRVLADFGSFSADTREGRAEAFLRRTGADSQALAHGLEASVDTPPAEISAVSVPALVAVGAEDDFHRSSAERLADALRRGRLAIIPGSHPGAVLRPELGEEIAGFLGPANLAKATAGCAEDV
jgi:pimeloyl-ACP methyl ester carboxylesterase